MGGDCWERIWKGEAGERIEYGVKAWVVDIFREFGAVRVCDAACGYGAYSVALASNGFEVYSFDISESAAAITRAGLERFGLDSARVKTADILLTGYEDGFFDAVVAGSVLDHMSCQDAKRALLELRRITKPGGLIMVTLDPPEEDDLRFPHELLPDGSILYTSGSRRGMVLHPYDEAQARRLLDGLEIVYTDAGRQDEQVFIFKNPICSDIQARATGERSGK